MIVSGRNNVKELLNNYNDSYEVKKAYLQNGFNEKYILSLLKKFHINYEFKEKYELDLLAKNNHQGVLLDIGDFNYCTLDSIIENKDKCAIVILDHLEDPHNLGAIVRTCEAAKVDGIILPKNRSVSVNETVLKTSVGAIFNTKICQVTNLASTIKYLKKNGFWLYGADMEGVNYKEITYSDKCCLVIGNEGNGLARIVSNECDYIVSIPMYGKVNSLNASVAAGILVYEVINR